MNRTKFDEVAAQNSIRARFILRTARVHVSKLLNFFPGVRQVDIAALNTTQLSFFILD